MEVDPSNSEQFRAWNEDEGPFWASHADYFDRSARSFHERVLGGAAIGASERVLDIGCGTGRTTVLAAKQATNGSALGIDLSAPMLEEARARAAKEGADNASFEQADAQVHPFDEGGFDVAISSMGAQFFGDPIRAYSNIGRSLRHGGRLAILTWQSMLENEWFREFRSALAAGRDLPLPAPGAPGPFAFADAERDRSLLSAAGFATVELDDVHEGMWFGADVDEASQSVLGIFGWMLDDLAEDDRTRALDLLRSTLAAHETTDGVVFDSAVWLIRAQRP